MPQEKRRVVVGDLSAPSGANIGPQVRTTHDFFQARPGRRQIGTVDFASLSATLANTLSAGQKMKNAELREGGAVVAEQVLALKRSENIEAREALAKLVADGTIEEFDSPQSWIGYREVFARDAARRASLAARIALTEQRETMGVGDSGVPGVGPNSDAIVEKAYTDQLAAVAADDPDMAKDYYFQRMFGAARDRAIGGILSEHQVAVSTMRMEQRRSLATSQLTDLMFGVVGEGDGPATWEDVQAFQIDNVYLGTMAGAQEIYHNALGGAVANLRRLDEEDGGSRAEDLLAALEPVKLGPFTPSESQWYQELWQAEAVAAEGRPAKAAARLQNRLTLALEEFRRGEQFTAFATSDVSISDLTKQADDWYREHAREEFAFEKWRVMLDTANNKEAQADRTSASLVQDFRLAVALGNEAAAQVAMDGMSAGDRADAENTLAAWSAGAGAKLNSDQTFSTALKDLSSALDGIEFPTAAAKEQATALVRDAVTQVRRSSMALVTGDGSLGAAETAAKIKEAGGAAQAALDKVRGEVATIVSTHAERYSEIVGQITLGNTTLAEISSPENVKLLGPDAVAQLRGLHATATRNMGLALDLANGQDASSTLLRIYDDPQHASYGMYFTLDTNGNPKPTPELMRHLADVNEVGREAVRTWLDSPKGREALLELRPEERSRKIEELFNDATADYVKDARSGENLSVGVIDPDEKPPEGVSPASVLRDTVSRTVGNVAQMEAVSEVPIDREAADIVLIDNVESTEGVGFGVPIHIAIATTGYARADALLAGLNSEGTISGEDVKWVADTFGSLGIRISATGLELGAHSSNAIARTRNALQRLLHLRNNAIQGLADAYTTDVSELLAETLTIKSKAAGPVPVPIYVTSRLAKKIESNESAYLPSVLAVSYVAQSLKRNGDPRAEHLEALIPTIIKRYDETLVERDETNREKELAYVYFHQDAVLPWRNIAEGFYIAPREGKHDGITVDEPGLMSPARHKFVQTESALKDMFRPDNREAAGAFLEVLGIDIEDKEAVSKFRAQQTKLIREGFF